MYDREWTGLGMAEETSMLLLISGALYKQSFFGVCILISDLMHLLSWDTRRRKRNGPIAPGWVDASLNLHAGEM